MDGTGLHYFIQKAGGGDDGGKGNGGCWQRPGIAPAVQTHPRRSQTSSAPLPCVTRSWAFHKDKHTHTEHHFFLKKKVTTGNAKSGAPAFSQRYYSTFPGLLYASLSRPVPVLCFLRHRGRAKRSESSRCRISRGGGACVEAYIYIYIYVRAFVSTRQLRTPCEVGDRGIAMGMRMGNDERGDSCVIAAFMMTRDDG